MIRRVLEMYVGKYANSDDAVGLCKVVKESLRCCYYTSTALDGTRKSRHFQRHIMISFINQGAPQFEQEATRASRLAGGLLSSSTQC